MFCFQSTASILRILFWFAAFWLAILPPRFGESFQPGPSGWEKNTQFCCQEFINDLAPTLLCAKVLCWFEVTMTCGYEQLKKGTLVVPSGCLSCATRRSHLPKVFAVFSFFFSSRARFLGWCGVGSSTCTSVMHLHFRLKGIFFFWGSFTKKKVKL